MRRFEQFSVDQPGQVGGETAIDTQVELDLLSGGVGFDDGPTDDKEWLIEARNKQRKKIDTEEA